MGVEAKGKLLTIRVAILIFNDMDNKEVADLSYNIMQISKILR
jgi:hypothetical protein